MTIFPAVRTFRPGVGPGAFSAVVLGVLLGGAASGIQAQDPERTGAELRFQSVHAVERPTFMSPASGPPGTTVVLRASLLPALTPVQVALGGTRSGFEALSLALTDRNGDLVERVTIPAWAARDRAHRFIVFNAYFSSVYAATGLFHVTDDEGKLRREGVMTTQGPGCPTLAGVDNEIYSLMGNLPSLEVGARVTVEGHIVPSVECGEGMTLQVAALEGGGG
jgi:hypothetical protein